MDLDTANKMIIAEGIAKKIQAGEKLEDGEISLFSRVKFFKSNSICQFSYWVVNSTLQCSKCSRKLHQNAIKCEECSERWCSPLCKRNETKEHRFSCKDPDSVRSVFESLSELELDPIFEESFCLLIKIYAKLSLEDHQDSNQEIWRNLRKDEEFYSRAKDHPVTLFLFDNFKQLFLSPTSFQRFDYDWFCLTLAKVKENLEVFGGITSSSIIASKSSQEYFNAEVAHHHSICLCASRLINIGDEIVIRRRSNHSLPSLERCIRFFGQREEKGKEECVAQSEKKREIRKKKNSSILGEKMQKEDETLSKISEELKEVSSTIDDLPIIPPPNIEEIERMIPKTEIKEEKKSERETQVPLKSTTDFYNDFLRNKQQYIESSPLPPDVAEILHLDQCWCLYWKIYWEKYWRTQHEKNLSNVSMHPINQHSLSSH
eukprot:TRINITY_DN13036_c0_g1_i1.p1 TRINITY_DN13036_c0_g1~~TRINITY_DN13036_c0_g1_i1.p1  ORF type:complete len:431 (+),score=134.58 TRINITY_DN13036_c0_g1_i1:59-1351(+)